MGTGDVCNKCVAIETQQYVSCWSRSLRKSENIFLTYIYIVLKFVNVDIMRN